MENKVESRKEAVVNWLKKPSNLLLIAILIFAFCIRLYYFNMTAGQALWWDEAEYMSTAKHWAFGVPYDLNPQRPPLFQFLAALAFMIGLGEQFIKFAFTLLPSVLLVFVIYLLGKEMYNKKVGLIAAFLGAISWTFVFWSSRVQPDFLSMAFQVAAVLFMWKYWKTDKTQSIIWAAVFAAAGFYFKVSALLVPVAFMVFILVKDRLSAFTNKKYYYFAGAYLLTMVPYFLWSYFTFGTLTAFKAGYSNSVIGATPAPTPFGWYNLNFFYILTENLLFVLFILGLIVSLKFLLYIDVLIKDKKKVFDPDLFSIIVFAVVAAFYIFYIRGTEDRWVFLWLPFIFLTIGNALMFIYNLGKKYSKYLSVALVIGLLAFGGYMQYKHADALIKMKEDSYMPVKLGSLWIKDHSEKGASIASISYTQSVYYTERNVSSYSEVKNESDFSKWILENKIKYLMVSVFEPHPGWIQGWLQNNQAKLKVVDAYFADKEKQQAMLVVYEVLYPENMSLTKFSP